MPYSFLISSIRGTMFLPRIPYEWSFVSGLLERFPGFIPTVYGSPKIEGNIVYSPGDWELRTQDGTKRIIFQAQKIDYVETGEKAYSQVEIGRFAELCKDFFSELAVNRGQLSSRLAIAPSFVCNQPFNEVKGFLSTIYRETKNSFGGSEVDSCEFSQVFRPNKLIEDANVAMNFLSRFSTEMQVSVIDGITSQVQKVKADFDINTMPVNGLSFTMEAIRDFFAQAHVFCDEFYCFYFGD